MDKPTIPMKLALGTVQLGLPYGVSSANRLPDPAEVKAILSLFAARGGKIVETAPVYGDAEAALGRASVAANGVRIVTKVAPVQGDAIRASDMDLIRSTFETSLAHLRADRVDTLLVHHCRDLLMDGGDELYEWMMVLKDANRVGKIGASIYTAEDIDLLMDRYDLDVIQLPLNVLDQRLIHSGHVSALKDAGIEVHARSAFLQGLLLMDPDSLPDWLAGARTYLYRFRAQAAAENLSPLTAALAFVLRSTDVDVVLIGVTTAAELNECIEATRCTEPFDGFRLACDDLDVVDPTRWPS